MEKIVLASNSPRRREIMEQVGLKFEIIPSDVEEKITKTLPEEVVKELSYIKAKDVMNKLNRENKIEPYKTIVIGADTIVAYKHSILGKPKSKEEAYKMINMIQGDIHSVYTGVTMIMQTKEGNFSEKIFAKETKVVVRKMTEKQIEDYIETNEPYDKAGGYAIQGTFAKYIKGIEGDYYNVVGLPISELVEQIEKYKK